LERSKWDEFNDTKKGHQLWPEQVTQVAQRQVSPNTFKRIVWLTLFIVCDFFSGCWIHLVEIFLKVLSSLEFWCAFSVIFFSLYLFFSLSSCNLWRNKRENKITLEAHRAPMITPLVLLKRSRQDKFNVTKESHKQWTK
jgi:hypothetical protein